MIDTLRILVSWECNLKCPYCCNEQDRFRKDITPTRIGAINWLNYKNFCISGGEPLMNFHLVKRVCEKIPAYATKILYTNGIYLNAVMANMVANLGIEFVNVGLHHPSTYKRLIESVTAAVKGTGLKVRFHAQDIYEKELTAQFPDVAFRFWKMDDCDRSNEERIVLAE